MKLLIQWLTTWDMFFGDNAEVDEFLLSKEMARQQKERSERERQRAEQVDFLEHGLMASSNSSRWLSRTYQFTCLPSSILDVVAVQYKSFNFNMVTSAGWTSMKWRSYQWKSVVTSHKSTSKLEIVSLSLYSAAAHQLVQKKYFQALFLEYTKHVWQLILQSENQPSTNNRFWTMSLEDIIWNISSRRGERKRRRKMLWSRFHHNVSKSHTKQRSVMSKGEK